MFSYPVSPTIVMARDPYSFPSTRNPFTAHFPMPRDIFPWRRGIIRFWRGRVNDPRRRRR